MVNTCYPMSVEVKSSDEGDDLRPVYAATSDDFLVRFSAPQRALLFKALLDTIPEFRSQIRIFSPRSALYTLYRQHLGILPPSYPCRGGIDFFFVDSRDGHTYPCGYRGNESFGAFWDMDWDRLDSIVACYRCDWECFRDPSELLGPLLHAASNPWGLLKRLRRDVDYFRLWGDDLKYYRACELFDGRKPPDLRRLCRLREHAPSTVLEFHDPVIAPRI
jgi:hypothetical protein